MRDRLAGNLILKLIEETSRRSIAWSIEEVPEWFGGDSDEVINLFLVTSYRQQRIALYEARFRHFIDEQNFSWLSNVRIALLDNAGRLLWRYEGDDKELQELFQDARRSLAEVDAFLKQFRTL